MASNDVRRENYISIQGWMVTDLDLKGNELIIYASIYGFSQAEDQTFHGSLQYLANWTNSTKQGVIKCLKSLESKGYIVKKENFVNGVKFCEYYATKFNDLLNKDEQGSEQSLTRSGQQSLPNTLSNKSMIDNIKNIIEYLNKKLGKRYSYKAALTQRCIRARFNEIDNLTVDDFISVIDKKCAEWKGTSWERYLRPETLFGNKFDGYLNAPATTFVENGGIVTINDKKYEYRNGKYYIPNGNGVPVDPYADTSLF